MAGIAILAVIIGAGIWNSRAGQDWLLEQAATAAMKQPPPMSEYDGLQVFMCGVSSPLPDPNRAQACVAVLAGESLYVIDTGAGSARIATSGRLQLDRLDSTIAEGRS